jgi:hypothetical protein
LCLGYKGVRDFVRKMDYCVKLPYSFIGAASASLSLEVISEKSPKAKNAFRDFPEMLVGPDQPASAFLCPAPGLRGSRSYVKPSKKAKNAFPDGSSYACRLSAKPLRFSCQNIDFFR